MASYTPACYSAAEQWDMVAIVTDKRDIRAGGMIVDLREVASRSEKGRHTKAAISSEAHHYSDSKTSAPQYQC